MGVYKEINDNLRKIHERISPEDLSWVDDMKEVVKLFSEFEMLRDFITAIETVKTELERSGKNKEDSVKTKYNTIKSILYRLERAYPDSLIERLKNKGYWLAKNNESLREAINDQMLRLLEQIRLGKRDAVCGMLLRIFVVKNVEFPQELIEAIKPKYDDNLFRAFMYSFLSAFITQVKEVENE